MSKTYGFIPIRSGSRGIPGKNIKSFCGKPLIYWMAKAANDSPRINKVFVAVDTDEYEEIIEDFHLSKVIVYRRDPENAQSNSQTEDVLLEFLDKQKFKDDDTLILIQATSPLTTEKDLTEALSEYEESECDSMLSTVIFKRFFWSWDGKPYNYDFKSRPLRQQWDGTLLENGSFYINKISNIIKDKCRLSGKVYAYPLPEWHQYEIDGTEDWEVLENIFRENILKYQESHIKSIKLVYFDVDGCLTDGRVSVDEDGHESVTFSRLDGYGIYLLKERGIKVAFITSEADPKAARLRARKQKIDYFVCDEHNKLAALAQICELEHITLNEVAGMGDDVNDFDSLQACAMKACPVDANDKIKNIPHMIILSKTGGHGAVREFIDEFILK